MNRASALATTLTALALLAGCGASPGAKPTITAAQTLTTAPAATVAARPQLKALLHPYVPPPAKVAKARERARLRALTVVPAAPPGPVTSCLRNSAMASIHQPQPGFWSARAAGGGALVSVDGPYRDHKSAAASVASLQGIEIAVAGGRYEVTAALRSNLLGVASAVAHCLGRR